jgi:hypothetical protein
MLKHANFVYPENTPTTKEGYHYRTIFEKLFPKVNFSFFFSIKNIIHFHQNMDLFTNFNHTKPLIDYVEPFHLNKILLGYQRQEVLVWHAVLQKLWNGMQHGPKISTLLDVLHSVFIQMHTRMQ